MIYQVIKEIRTELAEVLKRKFQIQDIPGSSIQVEKPRNPEHGDLSTNIAMQLAGQLKRKPLDIARELIADFRNENRTYSVTPPGFINIKFSYQYLFKSIIQILEDKDIEFYFNEGKGEKLQLEFISANPTGPLNVVNARAASVGDALANLFAKFGFEVEKEYYINDAGNQVDLLGKSVELALRRNTGEEVEFPEDCYMGDYVFSIAEEIKKEVEGIADDSERLNRIKMLSLGKILNTQKEDIQLFRLSFDNWFSEKTLYDANKHEKVLSALESKGLSYRKDGATWIKTTDLGDSQDWVIVKSDGSYTYLMGDIIYHLDKWERGFRKAINIWGPDHQAGVTRLKAALTAFSIPYDWLEVIIIQQVNLIRGGEKLKISKRKGIYETLRKLIDEVGVDAARFTFLLRSTNSHLDFDIDLAKKQISENPVYYIQYAHARICSIFRKAEEDGIIFDPAKADKNIIIVPETEDLIRKILEFHTVSYSALLTREPSRLTNYAMELADIFHSFYHNFRIVTEDKAESNSRLAICRAVLIVIREILDILGVKAPEKM